MYSLKGVKVGGFFLAVSLFLTSSVLAHTCGYLETVTVGDGNRIWKEDQPTELGRSVCRKAKIPTNSSDCVSYLRTECAASDTSSNTDCVPDPSIGLSCDEEGNYWWNL